MQKTNYETQCVDSDPQWFENATQLTRYVESDPQQFDNETMH